MFTSEYTGWNKGVAGLSEKLTVGAVKHTIRLLKFTEPYIFSCLFKCCANYQRHERKLKMFSEIFHVWFCSDRNFQLGCFQNKAYRITGAGHLLDIWWLFILVTELQAMLLFWHNFAVSICRLNYLQFISNKWT